MYSSSNQRPGGYSSSNSHSNPTQQTSFATYQPAPVYGSGISSQQTQHSQQGLFGGYTTHNVSPSNHHHEPEPSCCRIL